MNTGHSKTGYDFCKLFNFNCRFCIYHQHKTFQDKLYCLALCTDCVFTLMHFKSVSAIKAFDHACWQMGNDIRAMGGELA